VLRPIGLRYRHSSQYRRLAREAEPRLPYEAPR
jgi:hypothetical protein